MNNFTLNYRGACEFARSLLKEDYFYMIKYMERQSAFIKMKHRSNKNVIVVKVNKRGWTAEKNGKIIKHCE